MGSNALYVCVFSVCECVSKRKRERCLCPIRNPRQAEVTKSELERRKCVCVCVGTSVAAHACDPPSVLLHRLHVEMHSGIC